VQRIGAFHKYCYWRVEIRVSHTEVIRFSLPAQQPLLPHRGKSFSSSFTLTRLFSQCRATTTITTTTHPLLYIGRPTFLSLFPLVFLTRCPAFAAPFIPLPATGALYPPPVSCSVLFRAVEIVCPYGGRAAIRRGRSNEKGGVNGISRGRHGHRRQR